MYKLNINKIKLMTMKKFILSIFFVSLSVAFLSAQEMTLRLEIDPATPPTPGAEFFVNVWMDVLEYPGYPVQLEPTLKSGQMGVTYDPAVLTPVKTAGPPALQKYAWNLEQMFTDYGAVPAEALPAPGDLRFVSFTTLAPGMDPSFYGGIPMLMWQLRFLYDAGGGPIDISWQTTDKTTPVDVNLSGGIKEKIVTFWTAWDDVAYNMTYVNVGGGTGPLPTDWTGALDDVWNNPGNWTNDVPIADEFQVVTVDATTKAAPVIYGSAVAGTLNLVAGQLSIAPGGDLTTLGLFTNSGTLYMSSDGAGVAASFIDLGGLAGGGMFQFDRDVFCSGIVPNNNTQTTGYHYVSTPIPGFTTDDLPDYFVSAWDETTSMWMKYALDPYTFPCTPWPTTPLNPLEAWSINFDVTYPGPCPFPPGTGSVVEFMGPFATLNTGGFSLPATNSGVGAYPGWNMYGNPYPSAVDPSAFNWTGFDNGTFGVAIYDGCAGNYIYSNLGNSYLYNVGPTQGFFMLTTGATTFALAGTERVHDNTQTIWKDASNLVILEATGDGTRDETFINFMEGSAEGKDVADFPKLITQTEGLAQIYTTAMGENYAVNALPETPVVPMGFTSVTSGEYTISAVETGDHANVVLEDRFTGEQTDLLTSSYTFSYTVDDDPDRFFVHFTPLGLGDISANSINIWSNDHKIYVETPEIMGDIVVFNMMGQEVVRTEIEPGLNIIPVSDRNTYYVVQVVSSDVARTGKVYVK
jgi:hypothetical protein